MNYGHRELLWLLLLAPLTLALAAWFWHRRLAATRRWVSPSLWDRLRFHYRPRRLAFSLSCSCSNWARVQNAACSAARLKLVGSYRAPKS